MESFFSEEITRWIESNQLDWDKLLTEANAEVTHAQQQHYDLPAQPQIPVDPPPRAFSSPLAPPPPCKSSPTPNLCKSKRQFAAIKSDSEVELARAKGIPPKTLKDTKYCVGLWDAWTVYRRAENGDNIQSIEQLSRQDLQHWLTRFVLEVSTIYTIYPTFKCSYLNT